MPMPTLNMYVQIYMNKKTQHLLKLKLQIFLFFSEAFSVYEKAFEKKINICNFNKLCFLIFSYTAILFSSNSLLIEKLDLKISVKMLIRIGLIHLFCSPYLPKDSYRISIFVFPFF